MTDCEHILCTQQAEEEVLKTLWQCILTHIRINVLFLMKLRDLKGVLLKMNMLRRMLGSKCKRNTVTGKWWKLSYVKTCSLYLVQEKKKIREWKVHNKSQ